jgi:hypothetical protein
MKPFDLKTWITIGGLVVALVTWYVRTSDAVAETALNTAAINELRIAVARLQVTLESRGVLPR